MKKSLAEWNLHHSPLLAIRSLCFPNKQQCSWKQTILLFTCGAVWHNRNQCPFRKFTGGTHAVLGFRSKVCAEYTWIRELEIWVLTANLCEFKDILLWTCSSPAHIDIINEKCTLFLTDTPLTVSDSQSKYC